MTVSATDIEPRLLPGRQGQATTIEMSRVAAQVRAQILVAQQSPRDLDHVSREVLRACARPSMAENAFYRYPRGGKAVSGETIQLARELARCFGNMEYGTIELNRDIKAGISEMLAFAWDLETNTRPTMTFIVPHIRDTTSGPVPLHDVREIYELLTNMGSRRVREMIFAVLPAWLRELAVAECYRTLEGDADAGSLSERAEAAVSGFAGLGVTEAQLAAKLGAPRGNWVPRDLAQLTVIFRSLQRGETAKGDEFPAAVPPGTLLTAADIAVPAPAVPKPQRPKEASGE